MTPAMSLQKKAKRAVEKAVGAVAGTIAPLRWKEYNELGYWKKKHRAEGVLSNDHYVHFYTGHFGLDPEAYRDKVILDIGCGPRGSLEWADMARRRIGLDTLAREYMALGADRHAMEYFDAPSEAIPLDDGACDAVFSFNSLDHVESIEKTVAEIKRVLKPGGWLLLLVEINHPPTKCEPHTLTPQGLVDAFAPELRVRDAKAYRMVEKGMYQSILRNARYPDPFSVTEEAFFSARFDRV